MKFSLKSLVLATTMVALLFAVAVASFRRGVEAGKEAESARIQEARDLIFKKHKPRIELRTN